MEEETNLNLTDAGDVDVASSVSQEDVSQADNLENKSPADESDYYKRLTGRDDIKTREDFEKHYQGLKSLVGDQKIAELRRKAEEYEKLQAEISKEANEFLASEEGQEVLKDFTGSAIEEKVNQLEEEIMTSKFLKKNPAVEPFMDIIKSTAKAKGISYEEAYDGYLKDLINTKLEVDKAKSEEKSIAVESKQKTTFGNQAEFNQLIKAVRETDSEAAKQKLVEKFLKLS